VAKTSFLCLAFLLTSYQYIRFYPSPSLVSSTISIPIRITNSRARRTCAKTQVPFNIQTKKQKREHSTVNDFFFLSHIYIITTINSYYLFFLPPLPFYLCLSVPCFCIKRCICFFRNVAALLSTSSYFVTVSLL